MQFYQLLSRVDGKYTKAARALRIDIYDIVTNETEKSRPEKQNSLDLSILCVAGQN